MSDDRGIYLVPDPDADATEDVAELGVFRAIDSVGDIDPDADWLVALRLIDDDKKKDAEIRERLGRLILTDKTGASCFVWDQKTDTYRAGYTRTSATKALMMYCPSLAKRIVEQDGAKVPNDEIMHKVSRIVENIRYVAGMKGGEYDPSRKLLKVPAAEWAEHLVPERSDKVEKWLDLIGGKKTHKLLDWLATFRQVRRPTAAPYIYGPDSVGKGMLVDGLTKLYASGAKMTYEMATGDYHDLLMRTTLITADERMPDQGMRRGAPSAAFRRLVGDRNHTVNPKGLAPCSLEGALRLVITANGQEALNLTEVLSRWDVKALAKRLIVFEVGDDAAAYVAEQGQDETESWVEGEAIARHVLWLEANRKVVPGKRFLVEDDDTSQAEALVNSGNDRTLEALVKYLDGYSLVVKKSSVSDKLFGDTSTNHEGIVVHAQDLYVNPTAFRELWPKLSGDDRQMTLKHAGTVLSNASRDADRTTIPGTRIMGWRVSGQELLTFSETHGVGDPDKVQAVLTILKKTPATNP